MDTFYFSSLHPLPVIDNYHRREGCGIAGVPFVVCEAKPPANEADFRFAVYVIVKIGCIRSSGNKQYNSVPPRVLLRMPSLPTFRSRVHKADCRKPRRRDPSFAKARPFPVCSKSGISPFCRSPPRQARSRILHSDCRRSLAAYTSPFSLKIEAHYPPPPASFSSEYTRTTAATCSKSR